MAEDPRPVSDRLRKRAAAAVILALAAAAGLGTVLVTRSPVSAATSGVTITSGGCAGGGSEFCYGPETLTVPVGTTVSWSNMSGFSHTATSCTASACPGAPANTGTNTFSKSIASSNGSSNSFIFTSPGMYTYYCAIHGYSAMHAAVTVTGNPPTPTPTPIVLAPKIKTISPTSGKPGVNVTITGANLARATSVKFNGTTAHIVSDGGKKIVVTVPVGATTGKISVTTAGGTVMSTMTFTVT